MSLFILDESGSRRRRSKNINQANRENTYNNRLDNIKKYGKFIMIDNKESHMENHVKNNRLLSNHFKKEDDKSRAEYKDYLKKNPNMSDSDKHAIKSYLKSPAMINMANKSDPLSKQTKEQIRPAQKHMGGQVLYDTHGVPRMTVRKYAMDNPVLPGNHYHNTYDHERGHIQDYNRAYLLKGKKGVQNLVKNNMLVSQKLASEGRPYNHNYVEHIANKSAAYGSNNPQVVKDRERMVRAMTKTPNERNTAKVEKMYRSVPAKEYDKVASAAQSKRSTLALRDMQKKPGLFIDRTKK